MTERQRMSNDDVTQFVVRPLVIDSPFVLVPDDRDGRHPERPPPPRPPPPPPHPPSLRPPRPRPPRPARISPGKRPPLRPRFPPPGRPVRLLPPEPPRRRPPRPPGQLQELPPKLDVPADPRRRRRRAGLHRGRSLAPPAADRATRLHPRPRRRAGRADGAADVPDARPLGRAARRHRPPVR